MRFFIDAAVLFSSIIRSKIIKLLSAHTGDEQIFLCDGRSLWCQATLTKNF